MGVKLGLEPSCSVLRARKLSFMPLLGKGVELLLRATLSNWGGFLLGPEQCLLGKGVVAKRGMMWAEMICFFFSFYVMIHRSFCCCCSTCKLLVLSGLQMSPRAVFVPEVSSHLIFVRRLESWVPMPLCINFWLCWIFACTVWTFS